MKTLLTLLASAGFALAGDYDWQRDSDTFWQAWNARQLQNRYFQEVDDREQQRQWKRMNRQAWRNIRSYDDDVYSYEATGWVDED